MMIDDQEMREKRKGLSEAILLEMWQRMQVLKKEVNETEMTVKELIQKNHPELLKLIVTPATDESPLMAPSTKSTPWYHATGQEPIQNFFVLHSPKELSAADMDIVKEILANIVPDFNYGKSGAKNVFSSSGATGTPPNMNAGNLGIKFAVRINAIVLGAPPTSPTKQEQQKKKKFASFFNLVHHLKKWFKR